MSTFQTHDLSVTLGKRPILQDAAFTAQAGQVTAIVGPNGAGKTTLLKALCGDVPYRGSVTLGGANLAQMRPWETSALRAVLPQSSSLAFPFTVIEVVKIGLRSGLSAAEDEIALQALARVGLASYAHRNLQELSGGEQQRAHLARVLAQVWYPVEDGQPRWLLLDEPVASLDIAHQLDVMQIARDYATQGGGVIAVMHDLNLTVMFADQITVVAAGRIAAQGPVAEVMTDAVLSDAYGCALRVGVAPPPKTPFILPHMAQV